MKFPIHTLKRGDVREGDFDCLKGLLDGIEFDILPPLVPIDWENAVDVPLGCGETLKFVDLPALIHLKLRAGGPQDVLDVVTFAAILVRPDRSRTELTLQGMTAVDAYDGAEGWSVEPYLACGRLEGGFARIRCPN